MHAYELQIVRDHAITPAQQQGSATILEIDEQGHLLVDGLRAKRASSCLLEPAVGDRVWYVVESTTGACWVLAVLERACGEAPATLNIEGDAALKIEASRLSFVGEQGIEFQTRARVQVRADEVQVHARIGRAVLDEGAMVLRSLFTHASKSTFVGKVIETLAERITTHSHSSLRSVDELDQVQAGAIDYQAKSTAMIRAEHALVNGGELVKVDGGQIHFG